MEGKARETYRSLIESTLQAYLKVESELQQPRSPEQPSSPQTQQHPQQQQQQPHHNGASSRDSDKLLNCLVIAHTLFDTPEGDLISIWLSEWKKIATDKQKQKALFAVLLRLVKAEGRSFASQQQQKEILEVLQNNIQHVNDFKLALVRGTTQVTQKQGCNPLPGLPAESPSIDIFSLSDRVAARELTTMEAELFSQIRLKDLLTYKPPTDDASNGPEPEEKEDPESRKDKKKAWQPLMAMIEASNAISKWVATQILTTKGRSDQARLIVKFIRLAKKCLALNNFNSAMSVVSGLGHNSVQRLKAVWEKLPVSALESWSRMEELFSPQHNFKKYRRKLKMRKPPALPYLGIYLRDLTFIKEGNNKYTEDGAKINPELIDLLRERWDEISYYQSNSYSLPSPSSAEEFLIREYLQHPPYIDNEDILHTLSLQSQPSLWVDTVNDLGSAAETTTDEDSISSSIGGSTSQGRSSAHDDDDEGSSLTDSVLSSGSSKPSSPSSKGNGSKLANSSRKGSLEPRTDEDEDFPIDDFGGRGISRSSRNPLSDLKEEKNKKQKKKKTKKEGGRTPRTRESRPVPMMSLKEVITGCQNVSVPKPMEPAFMQAERLVRDYFSQCYRSNKQGTITVFDERYLMLRASALSVEFFASISEQFNLVAQANDTKRKSASGHELSILSKESEDFAYGLLFDFSHAVGKSDARKFRELMNLRTPLDALGAGPVHFSYSGWAFVNLSEKCALSPDANCFLAFDHPFSFEADSWVNQGEGKGLNKVKATRPVCIMSAGYSSGWVSECFGVPLVSVEVMCLARGDKACRFVMGHPDKIDEHVKKFFEENDITNEARKNVTIPKFLDSKKKNHFKGAVSKSSNGVSSGKEGEASSSSSSPSSRRQASEGLFERWKAQKAAKQEAKMIAANQSELLDLVMNKKNYDKKFRDYFSDLLFDPRHGAVKVNGERYIFVRGRSISVEFHSLLQEIFPKEQARLAASFAANFMFDFAKSVGKSDGIHFIEKSDTWDSIPIQKILALPTLLAQTGWGSMKVNSERSNLVGVGKDFLLRFTIVNSLEAQQWAPEKNSNNKKKKKRTPSNSNNKTKTKNHRGRSATLPEGSRDESSTRSPVCVMAAGYAMGYLNECIATSAHKPGSKRNKNKKLQQQQRLKDGAKVGVVEVACEAAGDPCCEFLCAPVEGMEGAVRRYLEEHKRTDPSEFERLHLTPAVKGKKEKKTLWSTLFA